MTKFDVDKLMQDIKESDDYEEFSKIKDIELTDEDKRAILTDFNNHIIDGIKTPCKIVLDKGKSGITNVKIKADSRMALMVTLIGAIESIRKEHNISQFECDLLSMTIGYEETD